MKAKLILAFTLLIVTATALVQCKKDTTQATCTIPGSLHVTALSSTGATLHWSQQSAAGYTVQYRYEGTATWSTLASTADSLVLPNLAAGARYIWQVSAVCGTGATSYSDTSSFTTLSCAPGYEGIGCATPTTAKFAGVYNVLETYQGPTSGSYNYHLSVTAAGTNALMLDSLGAVGIRLPATINSTLLSIRDTTFTVSSSNITFSNIAGQLKGDSLFIDYTWTDPSGVYIEHAVGVK